MRSRHVRAALIVGALTVMVFAGAAAAKTPKVGGGMQAQGSLSPLEDQIQFQGSIASKLRACAVRTVEIRRPAGNVLLDTFPLGDALKVGKVWSTAGDGDYHLIAGYVTRGESLVAIAPQKKLKKGGRVTAVCKPVRKSFVVP